MSLFVQFVRGLGARPQRFWLCLEPIESVEKEELITLSVAGHYNSGQVELESVCLYYNFHFLSAIVHYITFTLQDMRGPGLVELVAEHPSWVSKQIFPFHLLSSSDMIR